MADQNAPNDASKKTKAEGERWTGGDMADANQLGGDTGSQGGGITNRPLDEEEENQQAVPERGDSQYGANAGHGQSDPDPKRGDS
jgi:hypothetical protein